MTNREFKQAIIDRIIAERYSNAMIIELAETFPNPDERIKFLENKTTEKANFIDRATNLKATIKKLDSNDHWQEIEPTATNTGFEILLQLNKTFESFRKMNELINQIEGDQPETVTELRNLVNKERAKEGLKQTLRDEATSTPKDAAIRALIELKYSIKYHLKRYLDEIGYNPEIDRSSEKFDPIAEIEAKIEELKSSITVPIKKGNKVKFNLNKTTIVTLFADLWDNHIIDQQAGMNKTTFGQWIRETFTDINNDEITESYATKILQPDNEKNPNSHRAANFKRIELTTLITAMKEAKANLKTDQ